MDNIIADGLQIATSIDGTEIPTIQQQVMGANLAIVDYQILFLEKFVMMFMRLFDMFELPYEDTAFDYAKSIDHPAVRDCGKTISTCGPWEIIWDNYIKLYNQTGDSRTQLWWYWWVKLYIIQWDFTLIAIYFSFPLAINGIIWAVKFFGILDL